MKFRLEKTIGRNKIVFEGEAKSNLEFFKNISFYSSLPSVCGNCSSAEIYPSYHETKEGYRYCKILCIACQHALNFGMYKDGNGALFQKKWELNNFNKQQEE